MSKKQGKFFRRNWRHFVQPTKEQRRKGHETAKGQMESFAWYRKKFAEKDEGVDDTAEGEEDSEGT